MSTNTRALALNDLAPIGQRIREREETIQARLRGMRGDVADLCILAREQGADLLTVEDKLRATKCASFEEWRACHAPTISAAMVGKYKRAAKEAHTPGQLLLIFGPMVTGEADEPAETGPQRTPPAPCDTVWGAIRKVYKTIRDVPLAKWTETQVDLTRRELEPLVKQLWPEKF